MNITVTENFGKISRRRSGGMLIELLICGVVIGVVAATLVPLARRIGLQRRYTAQREIAMLEVENLMEQATLVPWNDLTPERAALWRLSADTEAQLAEARLEITVQLDPQDAAAKIISIELNWELGVDLPAPPARLTAWVYSREKQP